MGNYQHELSEFPLPMLWYFENDSLLKEWKTGNDTSFEWILSGDLLQIDTMGYVIREFKQNQIKLEKKWALVFDKVAIDTPQINLAAINEIRDKTWQLKQKKKEKPCYTTNKYCFKSDTLWTKKQYWYDKLELGEELEKSCAIWHTFQDFQVLAKSGNWQTCDSLYAPLEIVVAADEYSYSTLTCRDGKHKRLDHIAVDPFEVNDSAFWVCQEYIDPYYATGLEYEGGTRQLKKEIWSKFKQQQYGSKNGYITIRFVINCAGKTGRFEIEQTDFNFEPIRFDKYLVKHLFLLTQSLNKWKIGKDKKGNLKDSRKFLTYKIENGELKKILP